jgi:hypothetical protein
VEVIVGDNINLPQYGFTLITRWTITNCIDNISVSYYAEITMIIFERPTAHDYSATEMSRQGTRKSRFLHEFGRSRVHIWARRSVILIFSCLSQSLQANAGTVP